jgi:two-component system sensor histidine kinase YesM
LPENILKRQTPRLILLPLVENAYEHGLKNKEENGLIRIGFTGDNGLVRITVEDNGDELDAAVLEAIRENVYGQTPRSEHTGLYNVHRRIKLAYKADSGLVFSQSGFGGLKAEIKIDYSEAI